MRFQNDARDILLCKDGKQKERERERVSDATARQAQQTLNRVSRTTVTDGGERDLFFFDLRGTRGRGVQKLFESYEYRTSGEP